MLPPVHLGQFEDQIDHVLQGQFLSVVLDSPHDLRVHLLHLYAVVAILVLTTELGNAGQHWNRQQVRPFLDLLVDRVQIQLVDDPSPIADLLLLKVQQGVFDPVFLFFA